MCTHKHAISFFIIFSSHIADSWKAEGWERNVLSKMDGCSCNAGLCMRVRFPHTYVALSWIFFPCIWRLHGTQPHYLSSFRSASVCSFETSKLLIRSLVRLISADKCTTAAQSRGQVFTSNTGDRTNAVRQICSVNIGGGECNYLLIKGMLGFCWVWQSLVALL